MVTAEAPPTITSHFLETGPTPGSFTSAKIITFAIAVGRVGGALFRQGDGPPRGRRGIAPDRVERRHGSPGCVRRRRHRALTVEPRRVGEALSDRGHVRGAGAAAHVLGLGEVAGLHPGQPGLYRGPQLPRVAAHPPAGR